MNSQLSSSLHRPLRMLSLCCMLFFASSLVHAQSWKLKEVGVGLVKSDEQYDKELKVVKRGNSWNQRELYESGAFSGRGTVFAAWIVGPHTNDYLNSSGVPAWLYKYTVTYPDGRKKDFGPSGFYTPGFSWFMLNASSAQDIGEWKIDFSIVNRDSGENRSVGSVRFTMKADEPQKEKAGGWALKEIGVGIYDDAQYDTVLKIEQRGDSWSQGKLYGQGNFAGRGKVFGAWIVGPPVKQHLDKNGNPIYSYKYKLTYPDGSVSENGPYSFYMPGFSTFALPLTGGNCIGRFKLDFYILNKETQQNKMVGSHEFRMDQ